MKQLTKKVLSLLMAMAIVCTMIPTALAEGETEETCDHTYGEWTTTKEATCEEAGGEKRTCSKCQNEETRTVAAKGHTWDEGKVTTEATCVAEGVKTFTCTVCQKTKTENINKLPHEVATDAQWQNNAEDHWKICSKCNGEADKAKHTWVVDTSVTATESGHGVKCSVCGYTKTASHDATHSYKDKTLTKHTEYCATCGYIFAENADHAYTETGDKCKCGAVDPAKAELTVAQNPTSTVEMGTTDTKTFSVTPTMTNGATSLYDFTYSWTVDTYSYGYNTNASLTLDGDDLGLGNHTVSCTVTPIYKGTGDGTDTAKTVSWSVKVENIRDISLTIYENAGTYSFDDDTTEEGYSVYDIIDSALGSYESLYENYITVTPTTGYNGANYAATLNGGGISYYDYLTIHKAGTWKGSYVVKNSSGATILTGDITIDIKETTGSDIIYTASVGEEVALNIDDFYTFWDEVTDGRGELDSVTFGSIATNKGTLCYGHTYSEKNHTSASGKTYNTEPTGNEKYLDDLTFFPKQGSNKKYPTGSVSITFTAKGSSVYGGSNNKTAHGEIVILYTDGAVPAIDYAASSVIVLDEDDFTAVYKQAMDTTSKNPSFTIKFLDAPVYGSLYTSYKEGSYNRPTTGTEITDKNLNSSVNSFRNTAASIGKVTYVPGYFSKAGESLRYAVYSGNTLQYIGTVNFGVTPLEVTYTATSAGVNFKAADFFSGSAALLLDGYITFGTPSSGTLYNGNTRVTSSDRFYYRSSALTDGIGDVKFVPDRYSGTVEIPFTITSSGRKTNGVVKISVITKTFVDVKTSAWYYDYVMRMVAAGVAEGTDATHFTPGRDVKWGEALKMLLLAAGYEEQYQPAGSNWAVNYVKLAYNEGIIDNDKINANSAISRLDMAKIAARALGLPKASKINAGITGPTDTKDGYVYALYNAGILDGITENGKNLYKPARTIHRDEITKIVCLVMDYQG